MYLRLTSLNAHKIKYLVFTNQLRVQGAAFPIGTLQGFTCPGYLSWIHSKWVRHNLSEQYLFLFQKGCLIDGRWDGAWLS